MVRPTGHVDRMVVMLPKPIAVDDRLRRYIRADYRIYVDRYKNWSFKMTDDMGERVLNIVEKTEDVAFQLQPSEGASPGRT